MSKNTAKGRKGKQNNLQTAKGKSQTISIPEKSTPKKAPVKKTNTKKVEDDPEYYPDKKKRPSTAKKVVMKQKCNLKVIGGVNGVRRRKSEKPVKGLTSPALSDSDWEPQIAIQAAELDWDSEEDLMEILTCPSPVWWEDPPDAEFCEDPIFLRKQKEVVVEEPPQTTSNTTTEQLTTTEAVNIKVEIDKKDDKFIEKRSKLENVLGNIKNKKVDRDDESITFDESLAIDVDNIKIPIANIEKAAIPSPPPLFRCPDLTIQSDSISDKDVKFLDDSESAVKSDRRQSRRIKTMGDGDSFYKKDDFYYTFKGKASKTSPKKGKSAKEKVIECKCQDFDVTRIRTNTKCVICKGYVSDYCNNNCKNTKYIRLGIELCKCKLSFAYKCKLCDFDTFLVEDMQKHLETHNCKKSIVRYWKQFCFAVQS